MAVNSRGRTGTGAAARLAAARSGLAPALLLAGLAACLAPVRGNAMQEPIMSDVARLGVLAHLDPASGSAAPGLRDRLRDELAAAVSARLSNLPVEIIEVGDPRLLQPDRVSFVLHALARPAGEVVPGAAGSVVTLSLRRARHAPSLPPGPVLEAAPVAVHLPGAGTDAVAPAVRALVAATLGQAPRPVPRSAPGEGPQ